MLKPVIDRTMSQGCDKVTRKKFLLLSVSLLLTLSLASFADNPRNGNNSGEIESSTPLRVTVRGIESVSEKRGKVLWGLTMYLSGKYKDGKWVSIKHGITETKDKHHIYFPYDYVTDVKMQGEVKFHVDRGQKFIAIMEKKGNPEQKRFGNDNIIEVNFEFRVVEVTEGDFDFSARLVGSSMVFDFKNRKKKEVTTTAMLALSKENAYGDVLFGGNPSIVFKCDRNRYPKSLKLDFPKGYLPLGFMEQVFLEK